MSNHVVQRISHASQHTPDVRDNLPEPDNLMPCNVGRWWPPQLIRAKRQAPAAAAPAAQRRAPKVLQAKQTTTLKK